VKLLKSYKPRGSINRGKRPLKRLLSKCGQNGSTRDATPRLLDGDADDIFLNFQIPNDVLITV
jgi:hypothetical protein